MQEKMQEAVDWALNQKYELDGELVIVSKETPHFLVEKVREYLNRHAIEYDSFCYEDLIPYLPQ